MRDRMERLVVLPFSIGCASQSSVALRENLPKNTKETSAPRPLARDDISAGVKIKSPLGFLLLSKPNISIGLQRLIKSIKSLSHIFVYKEEEGGEEMEMEMEIGFPTDVKHVTHIGWDGSSSTTTTKSITGLGWDTHELLSLPSISLKHFHLAMAAQADDLPISSTTRLA